MSGSYFFPDNVQYILIGTLRFYVFLLNFNDLCFRLKDMETRLREQRMLMDEMTRMLQKMTRDEKDPEALLALSIAEKARKRNKRTEEDSKHAARIYMSKKNLP